MNPVQLRVNTLSAVRHGTNTWHTNHNTFSAQHMQIKVSFTKHSAAVAGHSMQLLEERELFKVQYIL